MPEPTRLRQPGLAPGPCPTSGFSSALCAAPTPACTCSCPAGVASLTAPLASTCISSCRPAPSLGVLACPRLPSPITHGDTRTTPTTPQARPACCDSSVCTPALAASMKAVPGRRTRPCTWWSQRPACTAGSLSSHRSPEAARSRPEDCALPLAKAVHDTRACTAVTGQTASSLQAKARAEGTAKAAPAPAAEPLPAAAGPATMAWAFVPLMPKELVPAEKAPAPPPRLLPQAAAGAHWRGTEAPFCSPSPLGRRADDTCGFRVRQWESPGHARWWRAIAVISRPVSPAAPSV